MGLRAACTHPPVAAGPVHGRLPHHAVQHAHGLLRLPRALLKGTHQAREAPQGPLQHLPLFGQCGKKSTLLCDSPLCRDGIVVIKFAKSRKLPAPWFLWFYVRAPQGALQHLQLWPEPYVVLLAPYNAIGGKINCVYLAAATPWTCIGGDQVHKAKETAAPFSDYFACV